MAAWGIEINDMGPGADLGTGERIAVALQVQFFFTRDEIGANEALAFLGNPEEMDRLMQPENYQEWQETLQAAMKLVMEPNPEAADINGERVDMSDMCQDEDEALIKLAREITSGDTDWLALPAE